MYSTHVYSVTHVMCDVTDKANISSAPSFPIVKTCCSAAVLQWLYLQQAARQQGSGDSAHPAVSSVLAPRVSLVTVTCHVSTVRITESRVTRL